MEAYTDFAQVYDTFMDDTPYQEWADFLAGLIDQYGVSRPVVRTEAALPGEAEPAVEDALPGEAEPAGEDALPGESTAVSAEELQRIEEKALLTERNLVVDLGCGTGTLTELLYQKGYDMIGIDRSEEMLNIAMTKKEASGSEILYLCQDMQELDLYSTVGTVISVCDSLNYLLEEEELVETFRLVNNYLYPGGIFIFDFNTLYKYQEIIGERTIAENREESSFIWENFFDRETGINEYDLTIFVREQGEYFRRFTETHYQRGYTREEMEAFVKEAGLELLLELDGDTHEAPAEQSQRIYMVCRGNKQKQQDKSEEK